MGKRITEIVWTGHDNAIDLELRVDGALADLSGTTRVTLTIGAVTLDSDEDADLFDWSAGSGILSLHLGAAGLDAGNEQAAKLVIYDAGNTNGVVWGEQLRLTVQA